MAMAACNTRQRLSEVNPDGVKYFMEKLLFQIYEHFDEQDLIDVTFKLSNPTALTTAHRLILSAASPYFRELFKSDKGFCPVIEITDIDSDTFERLITFCYTGKTLITIDNVDRMLKAALILQLDDAVANCADFLIDHITVYTLQRAYSLESETHCEILNQKLMEHETKNFMSVIQSTDFFDFDAKKLKALIESDHLNVKCEKDVFEAVKRWYEHKASARKQQLPDLIACLRLIQFDMDFIMTNIHPLPGCQHMALEALTWSSYPSARSKLSLKYTKQRVGQIDASGESLLAFNLTFGTIFQYNKTEELWHKWVDIKIDSREFGAIFMDDNLIFIGGFRSGQMTNEVSSWNFKTKTFKQLPAMNQRRRLHSIVILNKMIYAIGGWDYTKTLQSVEMYSVSNGWKLINNMITPRHDASAVALNDKIYVMGGVNNNNCLTSVECYDPTTSCWTQCANMNKAHYNTGATVHNGKIFILGGSNSTTVERYDPQRNEWTKLCSLGNGIQRIGSISIDYQLWAVGGTNSNYVSIYDEQNDKWIDKERIPSAGHYYCFTVPQVLLQSEM